MSRQGAARSADPRHERGLAGGSFGETSIIDTSSRSADAAASTEVQLCPISRRLFLVLVQKTPHYTLDVMKSLTDRVRRANALGAAGRPSTGGLEAGGEVTERRRLVDDAIAR
jgi:CRP-like cAMP-binding protein